eukprot:UN25425
MIACEGCSGGFIWNVWDWMRGLLKASRIGIVLVAMKIITRIVLMTIRPIVSKLALKINLLKNLFSS